MRLGRTKLTLHADLTDVSTPHALVDLVAAVCSETEADTKITAHAGVSDAHHTPTVARTVEGSSYTGNAGVGRQIATGFKCSFVLITKPVANFEAEMLMVGKTLKLQDGSSDYQEDSANNYLHATDGFVVGESMNDNTVVYYYWAVSE